MEEETYSVDEAARILRLTPGVWSVVKVSRAV